MCKNLVRLVCTVILCVFFESVKGKLSAEINPNCSEPIQCNNITLWYVRSERPNNTLHYVWSFIGTPSLLIAQTKSGAPLKVEWNKFMYSDSKYSASFAEKPLYTFGLNIEKLWEFDDASDVGRLDKVNQSRVLSYVTRGMTWNRLQNDTLVLDPDHVVLKMKGWWPGITRGELQFEVRVSDQPDYNPETPHLLNTGNSSQLDIVLSSLETTSGYSSSRFGLEIIMVSPKEGNDTMKLEETKSLDDERSPGVFKVTEVNTPTVHSTSGISSGFLQWRPVSYTKKGRDVTDSTRAQHYDLEFVEKPSESLNNTLLYAFYGTDLDDVLLVQGLNVSFGEEDDGFYKKTNFTTWTVMTGVGQAPTEEFSLLVKLVILVGLGVPSIIILIGGIYVTVKRCRRQKDDLLLGS